MRIVQLSDIHLSNDNIEDLKNYYIEALIKDLKTFHALTPIDIIIFTGDLVDKGGDSLGDNPYQQFRDEVIRPLSDSFGLSSDKIFMVPGNHDVNRNNVDEDNEFRLRSIMTADLANKELNDMKVQFTRANNRIKKFKEFEKNFHDNTPHYQYSNNESLVIVNSDGSEIGLALINDSWRCSSILKPEEHFIGYNQLFNAKRFFLANNTSVNIAVFHHPLNAINQTEKDEIENVLKSQEFDIALFGHSHRHRADSIFSSIGGYFALNGRTAFNDSKETLSLFQPGYNILDINVVEKTYTVFARKFIRTGGYRFDKDTEALPDGMEAGKLPIKQPPYLLAERANNNDKLLPDSYTADVHRIVKLLIGKSLYPNPYIFVRELIQNSVDACNRVKDRHTHLTPKITIHVNTEENYIEVSDEGDGMAKHIIKNHFSVIGKSISQEFNDSTGNFNLISQFGIGFISTFIVAEKVIVNTKSEEDDQVMFEILDVFKGFNYLSPALQDKIEISGTSIKVYLKKDFDPQSAFTNVRRYCRHIDNLVYFLNATRVGINESWNTENSLFLYEDSNTKYEVRLGISPVAKAIIASNSGFLISDFAMNIVPHKFPYIIGGEVNFKPKGIDFDVSRSNIIISQKSEAFRREISVALRKLFRSTLEVNDMNVTPLVIGYLQYYLQYYDSNQSQMNESYVDFYSKKELISLCGNYITVFFQGYQMSLIQAINNIKAKGFNDIFIINQQVINDYHSIVVEYLKNMGNLVIKNKNTNVQFRDGAQTVSLSSILAIMAGEYGLSLQDVINVSGEKLKDMIMRKDQFHEKLTNQISVIENKYNIKVEIGKFNKTLKPSVRNENQIFLNHDDDTFKSLLEKIEKLSTESLNIYLLGLLGLRLDDFSTVN